MTSLRWSRSVVLHGVVISCLLIPWRYREPAKPIALTTIPIVEAKLIDGRDWEWQKEQKQRKEQEKQKQEEQRRLQLLEQKNALERQKQEREKALILEKQKREQTEKAKKEKARKVQQQMIDQKNKEKKRREEAAAEARLQDIIAQDGIQQRQASEMQRAIQRFRALISEQWVPPMGVLHDLRCVVEVRLSHSGEVLSARVTKSSGFLPFDRGAEHAVLKASPLPLPSDPKVADALRTFTFTFHPEGL
jgi:colicin import membrane protein